MRGRAKVPAVAALFLLLAGGCGGDGGAGAGDGSGVPTLDAPAARAVLEGYLGAVEARDTAALRRLYVSDGRFTWMEDGVVAYRTPEEVFAGLGAFPPDLPLHTELGEVEAVEVARGGALAWAPFTTRVGEGDGAYAFGGLLSFVLEWDGSRWRIVGGHTSSTTEP